MKRKFFINLLFVLCSSFNIFAQGHGRMDRYKVQIDIQEAYLSGVCIIRDVEGLLTGAVVNEFGVSAVTFRYNKTKDKVKILSLAAALKRPGVKVLLKIDLRNIMREYCISEVGFKTVYIYENPKYRMKYNFTPIDYETD